MTYDNWKTRSPDDGLGLRLRPRAFKGDVFRLSSVVCRRWLRRRISISTSAHRAWLSA